MPTSSGSVRRRRSSPFGNRVLGPADQSPRQLRIRVQLLLTALLTGNNLIGAAVVFAIVEFVVPVPPSTQAVRVALAIAVPTYVAVAVVLGVIWGTATATRSLRWATVAGSRPTDAERLRALRVPMDLTIMQFIFWAGGTILFTTLALILQPGRALSTGLSVGLGAVVVAGFAYLLTEFALRPVAARALDGMDDPAPTLGVGPRMVLFWVVGTAVPVIGLMVVALLVLVQVDIRSASSVTSLAIVSLVLGGVVLVFGSFVTFLNARAVVAPILSVRDALHEVEEGKLDATVVVYDGTELGALQSGFNKMAAGLRERERIRDLFGRHVGQEVAQAAFDATGEVELGGVARVASVLFVDLVGSTGYATEHGPVEVVSVLNRFFEVVVDEVNAHNGLVNKFMGDAVLAIFGAPMNDAQHAAHALAAARAMAKRLAEEVPEVGAGVGIATGKVVAGNVGHEQRYEYTVIGDAVNSASRLTDLAKDVPGRVLAMQQTVDAAERSGDDGTREAACWRPDGTTVLRGRTEPTALAVPTK